ncbi:MAG: DUF423 domain-containing protein [Cyclobacteriaceae bacterium]|nr:MAG: DUF423 domain-containing protein [Cyclobacteriaceae bacterium]
MQKLILITGAISAGLSVAIGAFGAHALKDMLEASGRLDTFNTAVAYQFYHSLALLIIGGLMFNIPHKFMHYAAGTQLAGIFLFSGSLYLLCLSGNPKWGMVTPFGGLLFITGWILLTAAVLKST